MKYDEAETTLIESPEIPTTKVLKRPISERRMTTVDLFCGAGGFSEGFARAGYNCAYAVDFDEQAVGTFSFNHPNISAQRRDIRELSGSEILSVAGIRKGDVDVVIGGPPCQGFSLAGARLPDDPKNRLVLDYLRIVKELEPRYFVFENVSGIMSMNGGAVLQVLKNEFQSLGYDIAFGLLNSANYGVPQSRPRFIIIGSLDGRTPTLPLPTHGEAMQGNQSSFFGLKPYLTVKEALSDLPDVHQGGGAEEIEHMNIPCNDYQANRRGKRKLNMLFNHRATRHSDQITLRYSLIPPGETNASVPPELRTKKINVFRLHPDNPSRTVTCNFRTDLLHPWLPRGLTVREAARLQSFDDDYHFFGNLTRKARWVTQDDQVGNAVPPLLAETIARHLTTIDKK